MFFCRFPDCLFLTPFYTQPSFHNLSQTIKRRKKKKRGKKRKRQRHCIALQTAQHLCACHVCTCMPVSAHTHTHTHTHTPACKCACFIPAIIDLFLFVFCLFVCFLLAIKCILFTTNKILCTSYTDYPVFKLLFFTY